MSTLFSNIITYMCIDISNQTQLSVTVTCAHDKYAEYRVTLYLLN